MKKVQYETYYLYDEMESFLKEAAAEYPDLIKLESIAQTAEGREIYIAKITDFASCSNESDRGAYYVQACVHAKENASTTAALALIETLLKTRPPLLKNVIFYIVPRVNPDNTEKAIVMNENVRSKNDYKDKSPNYLIPIDINGDGKILSMRWEDPMGNMKELKDAPGILVPREPGDIEGTFYFMCEEGIIENYDGGNITNALRTLDFNRSMPSGWEPGFYSSDYPLRDIEVRAVAEFMVTHPNIFAGVDLHCGPEAILRPANCPDERMNKADLKLIVKIGQLASEITGFTLYREPDYGHNIPFIRHGSSNEWAYHTLGISFYVIELGNGYSDVGLDSNKLSSYYEGLKEIKEYNAGTNNEIYMEWQSFNHPQLGEVEMGGFLSGKSYYMNPKTMEKKVPKIIDFMINHAGMGPRIIIDNIEIKHYGENIYRVRADIMNVGHFSTKVMQGAKGYNTNENVKVYISGDENMQVISRPSILRFGQLNSCVKGSLEWFIKNPSGGEVEIIADHSKAKKNIKVDISKKRVLS